MAQKMSRAPLSKLSNRLFYSRAALTVVVTSLIVLVISVLLAGVVCYFAINVTSTRQQEENIVLTEGHVWYSSKEDASQAAIMITNVGGRDIVVQKVTVRGQTVDWSRSFYYKGNFTLTSHLKYIENIAEGSFTQVETGIGEYGRLSLVLGDLPLRSSESMLVYVKNPDSITINDISLTLSIDVYTMQAIYYKEANVETPIQTAP